MDVVISDARIDQLIAEDVPYIDLTTQMLGISDKPARIEFFTREDATVCATEEAARVAAFRCGSGVACSFGRTGCRGHHFAGGGGSCGRAA